MIGESFGYTAGGGNGVDIDVAVILSSKRHQLAIRRKERAALIAHACRETGCIASFPARDPQIAGIGKHHLRLAQCGMTHQPQLASLSKRQTREREQSDPSEAIRFIRGFLQKQSVV